MDLRNVWCILMNPIPRCETHRQMMIKPPDFGVSVYIIYLCGFHKATGIHRYTQVHQTGKSMEKSHPQTYLLISHRKMAAEVGDSCSNLVFGQARNWTHLKTHAITNRRQLTIDYIAIYGCKLEELKMSSLKQVLGILRSNI